MTEWLIGQDSKNCLNFSFIYSLRMSKLASWVLIWRSRCLMGSLTLAPGRVCGCASIVTGRAPGRSWWRSTGPSGNTPGQTPHPQIHSGHPFRQTHQFHQQVRITHWCRKRGMCGKRVMVTHLGCKLGVMRGMILHLVQVLIPKDRHV